MLDFLLNLRWWIPRCPGCRKRFEIFKDGLCFDCCMREIEARNWREITRAACELARAGVFYLVEGTLRVNELKARQELRRKLNTPRKAVHRRTQRPPD